MSIEWDDGLDRRLSRIARFSKPNENKILFIVIDGLGGLPHPDYTACGPLDDPGVATPKSELEWASLNGKLENLNEFVRHPKTVTGRIYPIGKGFTPGSVSGHLGLFGYDPDHYHVKRGPAEGAAIDTGIDPSDIVARLNFCHANRDGIIDDRRAGRISTSEAKRIASKIESGLDLNDAIVRVIPTAEHRGLLVLRKVHKSDPPLSVHICDTDPGVEGRRVVECQPLRLDDKAACRTAALVRRFTDRVSEILADEMVCNAAILRGFGTRPALPYFGDVYNVNALAIAAYPAYRGIAMLLGMAMPNGDSPDQPLRPGQPFGREAAVLKRHYSEYDFFYLHYKLTDEKGEDGDFMGKVAALHCFDRHLPELLEPGFDVVVITGDHATPSLLKRHSHHSVPLAIHSSVMKGYDRTQEFTEPACLSGARGPIDGPELMAIVLGNAGKLRKFDE